MDLKGQRLAMNLTQKEFANKFNIPLKTLQKWEQGIAKPPVYVLELIQKVIALEGQLNVLQ